MTNLYYISILRIRNCFKMFSCFIEAIYIHTCWVGEAEGVGGAVGVGGEGWVVGGCWSGSVGGGDHGEEGVFVDDGDAEGACLFELGGTHILAGEDVIGFARD